MLSECEGASRQAPVRAVEDTSSAASDRRFFHWHSPRLSLLAGFVGFSASASCPPDGMPHTFSWTGFFWVLTSGPAADAGAAVMAIEPSAAMHALMRSWRIYLSPS